MFHPYLYTDIIKLTPQLSHGEIAWLHKRHVTRTTLTQFLPRDHVFRFFRELPYLFVFVHVVIMDAIFVIFSLQIRLGFLSF